MPDRRPTPATHSSTMPSLEEVRAPDPTPAGPRTTSARTPGRALGVGLGAALVGVAGGRLLTAAEAPQCGQSRMEELTAHAGPVERAAQRADLTRVLREVGLATGMLRHRSTTLETDVTPAGAMPMTQDLPVDQPQPPPQPPPQPQLDPPQPVPGGMMQHTPLPAETQPPPPRVRPRVVPRPQISGGARVVHPMPHNGPDGPLE